MSGHRKAATGCHQAGWHETPSPHWLHWPEGHGSASPSSASVSSSGRMSSSGTTSGIRLGFYPALQPGTSDLASLSLNLLLWKQEPHSEVVLSLCGIAAGTCLAQCLRRAPRREAFGHREHGNEHSHIHSTLSIAPYPQHPILGTWHSWGQRGGSVSGVKNAQLVWAGLDSSFHVS